MGPYHLSGTVAWAEWDTRWDDITSWIHFLGLTGKRNGTGLLFDIFTEKDWDT